MTLHEFNQVTPLATEAPPSSSMNWADEMEKLDDTGKSSFSLSQFISILFLFFFLNILKGGP